VYPTGLARLVTGRRALWNLLAMLRMCCSLAALAVTFTGRPTSRITDAVPQHEKHNSENDIWH